MKKTYQSPEAEIISFTAMEKLATLSDFDLEVKLADLDGSFSMIDRV